MDLSLDNRTDGDRMVVDVGGEIDVYTAPKLRERLVELINSGHYHLIVNLEGVDFLDSTGLGVLVGALKRVRAHEGSLLLVCTQERLLKIFRITGLAKVFPIYDSVEAAAKAVATCPSPGHRHPDGVRLDSGGLVSCERHHRFVRSSPAHQTDPACVVRHDSRTD